MNPSPARQRNDELLAQRDAIAAALSGGLVTNWALGGFMLRPYVGEEDPEIDQACSTCMYYELHRCWCNLPELKLGVEPEWSCILWRV